MRTLPRTILLGCLAVQLFGCGATVVSDAGAGGGDATGGGTAAGGGSATGGGSDDAGLDAGGPPPGLDAGAADAGLDAGGAPMDGGGPPGFDGGGGPPGFDGGGGPPGFDGGSGAGGGSGSATAIGSVGSVTTTSGVACQALSTQQARVACAANAVLATLSSTELAGVQFALTDYVTRSKWNNLPVSLRPRGGTEVSALNAAAQAATLDLLTIALNSTGQDTVNGILRADDYLATMAGGYGSGLYSIAIFGTPSDTGDFEVMFGGHHQAWNLNFVGGKFFPVPQHLGAEPKASFTYDGGTWAPMAPKGDALFAVFSALDSTQRSTAYLSGQTFGDVIVNPDLDYGKGASRTSSTAYPTGSNRKGVLLSDMTATQQALAIAAIEEWVRQYPSEVADQLMSDYTSSTALADTYFAWGGSSSGADKDVSGSYLRIDGPRLWIELAVQGGIVIRNATHYHSIYHDKTYDYGGQF